MRTGLPFILLALALGLPALPPGAAQDIPPSILDFEMTADRPRADLEGDEPVVSTIVVVTVTDKSLDSPYPLVPPGTLPPGTPGPTATRHSLRFEITPKEDKAGWSLQAIDVPTPMRSGETRSYRFEFTMQPASQDAFFAVNVTATMTAGGQEAVRTIDLLGYAPGRDQYNVIVPETPQVKPQQVFDVPIRVTSQALLPRIFAVEVVSNPCGLAVVNPQATVIGARSTADIVVGVQAPAKRILYLTETCSLELNVIPSDNPGQVRTATVFVIVDGWYFNPVWAFWALAIVAALVLLYLVVARRKARIEEELLGKPQKPWTIPVERVYLAKLKEKDARAWYVVRHYLMEDEYRSALLWYKDYRRATKGKRTKERLVLRQEKGYEAWKAKWERRIAAPLAKADRFEARLGRKLDRKAARRHRKALRKHKVLLAKMEKAHGAQEAKAKARWERESRRAERKGLAAPSAPRLEEPDYPAEPRAAKASLKEHRYGRKAARMRRRMVRRQGNLEVRFERADARRLRKLKRKVQRLARRLEDPEFVAEHPMLRDA